MLVHRVQRNDRWPPAQVVAALLLFGCPQLLDDDFDLLRAGAEKDPIPVGAGPPDAAVDPRDGSAADAGFDADLDAGLSGSPDAGEDLDSGVRDAALPPVDAAVSDGGPDAAPVDSGPPEDPILVALRSALIHRYRFDGLGTIIFDSVGDAHGTAQGAVQTGGAAVLAGTGQYVDLPNGLISSLSNATLEAWVIWEVDPAAPTSSWQRIFDFGRNSSPIEGAQGSDARGLFLSPKSGGTQGKLHLEFDSMGNTNVDGPERMPAGVQVQVVAVVNGDADILALYQDGSLKGALSFPGSLSTVNDWNNWLGRSQFDGDPSFQGKILDFRIYAAALGSELIQASFAAGPDADW